jgi:CRISPR-associated protein Cmr6
VSTFVTIPMAGDLSELVGVAAEKIENRALLLDKYIFHKSWPVALDDRGREVKWDEASRWSFIRIADGAAQILNREADDKRRRSQGKNVSDENRQRYLDEANLAQSMAKVSWDTKEIETLRAKHTHRFLSLFRSAYGERSSVTVGQLEGRLAINLADSLIQNAGICLDRFFGLPFIPGSAVKGVCRHAALEELKAAENDDRCHLFEVFRDVFGTSDNDYKEGDLRPFVDLLGSKPENQRGRVSFLPAYPLNGAKIVVDLTNVHYPDYYRSGRTEDLSKEAPRPNPFPAVEVGAQFAFCILLNRPDVSADRLSIARHWLEIALTVRGIGAKTAAGYGWFSLKPEALLQLEAEERKEAEVAAARAKKEAEEKDRKDADTARLASMTPADAACEQFSKLEPDPFARKILELQTLSPDEQKGALLSLLVQKKDTWKAWKKSDKPTNKSRVELIQAVAKLHGIILP